MKVTEENLTEYKLNQKELKELISLVRREIQYLDDNVVKQTEYQLMLGKLLIMKYEHE